MLVKITKKRIHAKIPLTSLVLDPALQVRPVDPLVVEDYAQDLDALPAVSVCSVAGRLLLADGWHRYRAHELAGASEIQAIMMEGTMEEALLFIAGCDIRTGLRRSREAKRQAVRIVLRTDVGSAWSDREIALHCGVSHTFVGTLRARAGAEGPDESGNVATFQTQNQGTAVAGQHLAERDNLISTDKVAEPDTAIRNTARPQPHDTIEGTITESDQEDSVTQGTAHTGPTNGSARAGLPDCSLLETPTKRPDPLVWLLRETETLLSTCQDDSERRAVLDHLLEALGDMRARLAETEAEGSDNPFDCL